MNSRDDNQSANVSNVENQKKHKPKVKKSKKSGSNETLSSSKRRKPRTRLRWSPTGRIFDLSGQLIVSSESECQSNSSEMHVLLTLRNLQTNVFQIILLFLAGCSICLWCIDSGCSKHMTGNLKLLINFVWKFMGTVHFGNDHVAAILGYGDLQWGNILIA
ncbi:hypothetical protein Tco_0548188 [Tanacetum coccineum]